ncbi:MAG: DrmB family protein [Symbiobacteriia bacterium]
MAERKRIGEIRPSQLITTFGPGAIVDLPNTSAIVAGIDCWETRFCTRISEPRLQAKLGVKHFLTPPMPPELPFARANRFPTLPVFRFPEFMVCPTCRRLARYDEFAAPQQDGVRWCHHHGSSKDGDQPARTFPVRFIIACPNGHIHDLPWAWYVHGARKDGRECQTPDLALEERGATGSISDVVVRCRTCKAERSLVDAFRNPHTLGTCEGWRPWLGKGARESCGEQLRAMLRGASNGYFPILESALTIPPHADNPAFDVVGDLESNLEVIESLEELKESWKFFGDARQLGITPEQLWEAWQQQKGITAEEALDLHGPEWLELLRGSQTDGTYDFETEEQTVPDLFQDKVARLIQVRRLREVRVLSGFTRLDPPADATTLLSGEAEMQPRSRRAPITKQPRPKWLPGILVRGEGIFVALEEEAVKDWEKRVNQAIGVYMEEAYKQFCVDHDLDSPPPFPGVRYVLLHTLSHALMRQLGLNSGYSSTALRERIYCRSTKGQEMAGILIYTATPDSEGSLGGLVEQGQTRKFGAALWQALQDAQFCSSDPLCSEHDMKDHGDLNGAACHACSLVAETSCERSNRFLDRAFLTPTVAKDGLAFFMDIT